MKLFKKNFFKNFLLLFSSIFLVLLLFELYLRLFNPQIFDIHPKGLYVNDEDVGYVLNPGFNGYIQREEFRNKIFINNIGCRGNNFNLSESKTYRILVLGDSFAFGFGVEAEETFPFLLEKYLNEKYKGGYEVINAAVPGFGTVDELNLLKSIGKSIKPDLVILQFLSDNDLDENTYPAVEWATINDGWLSVKSTYISSDSGPFWKKTEYWLKSNFHAMKFISERIGFLLLKSGIVGKNIQLSVWGENFSKDHEVLFENVFVELVNYSKNQLNSDVILLYTTGQSQVLFEEYPELNSEVLISRLMSEYNIEWINIYQLMRKNKRKKDFYYPLDGHWNSEGHKFVSEILYNNVIKQ